MSKIEIGVEKRPCHDWIAVFLAAVPSRCLCCFGGLRPHSLGNKLQVIRKQHLNACSSKNGRERHAIYSAHIVGE